MCFFLLKACFLAAPVLAHRYDQRYILTKVHNFKVQHVDNEAGNSSARESEVMTAVHGNVSNDNGAAEKRHLLQVADQEAENEEILMRLSTSAHMFYTCDRKRHLEPRFSCLHERIAANLHPEGNAQNQVMSVVLGKCLGAGAAGMTFLDSTGQQILKVFSPSGNVRAFRDTLKRLKKFLAPKALSKLKNRNDVDSNVLQQGVELFVPFISHGTLVSKACGSTSFYTQIATRAAGNSLYEWLKGWAVPCGQSFARIGIGIVSSLYVLQLRDHAHNDVQPANIMWDGKGLARLIDYDTLGRIVNKRVQNDIENDIAAAKALIRTVLRMTPPYFVDICAENQIGVQEGCAAVAEGLPLQTMQRFNATSMERTPNKDSDTWLTFDACFHEIPGRHFVVKYVKSQKLKDSLAWGGVPAYPIVDADWPALDETDDSMISDKVGKLGLAAYRKAMAALAKSDLVDAVHSLEEAVA